MSSPARVILTTSGSLLEARLTNMNLMLLRAINKLGKVNSYLVGFSDARLLG